MFASAVSSWAVSAFFAMAVPVMLTWFWKWLEARGIAVDEKQRTLLHQALLTGARVVAARFGVSLKDQPIKLSPSMISDVIDHARKSSPGAMKHFDLTVDKISPKGEEVLENLAVSKIQEVVVAEAPGTVQSKAALAREKK